MVILPNTFYFPNYDDFNQQDQCRQHGHNQYNSLLDIQFHHHCLFSDAFLKPSACLIKGWTFEILFGSVSVKNTKSKFSQILWKLLLTNQKIPNVLEVWVLQIHILPNSS